VGGAIASEAAAEDGQDSDQFFFIKNNPKPWSHAMPLETKEEVSSTVELQTKVAVPPSATASTAQDRMPADGHTILHAYPSPLLESKWAECLQHATAPAHYASPAFFLEPYFRGKKPFAVLAIAEGEVIGVLTGLHEPGKVISGLETRVHIAMDERRDPEQALVWLMQGVNQESKGVPLVQVYSWRQLQLTPFMKAGYRKREFMGNPILDLSLGAETLIANCGKSQRRNIRFSAKNGVEIIEGKTREDFEAFYTIYERWSSVKQLAQYSKELEWEAFQTTQKNRCLFLARHEGRIIAGSFVRFYQGGLVECSRNFSLPEFLYLKPNDLLIGHTIEWACKRGFRLISLGAHHKFLRGFGGQITPIDRYRKDRTLLRRHDLQDFVMDTSRKVLHSLPPAWEEKVRKTLRREKPAGW
jgi:Acetyltransferase (GNAT) domain